MQVELTEEEYALVCGLIHPDGDINTEGIFTSESTWKSLREKFPFTRFYDAVANGVIDYDQEAGT